MLAKEQGEDKAKGASETVIYKIEVPANRLVHFEVNLYTHIGVLSIILIFN